MNDMNIKIFENTEFGTVRTDIDESGDILFCASDVAKALGYSVPRKAIFDHCRCVLKRNVPHPQSPDKTIEMSFIPESVDVRYGRCTCFRIYRHKEYGSQEGK